LKLTATGIVPDLHRASLFIPSKETNDETKVEEINFLACTSCSIDVDKHKKTAL
jgi:hypothetical protein